MTAHLPCILPAVLVRCHGAIHPSPEQTLKLLLSCIVETAQLRPAVPLRDVECGTDAVCRLLEERLCHLCRR